MRYVSDIQACTKVLCTKVSLQTSLLFENSVVLGNYAASSGNFSPTFRDSLSAPCSGEHGADRLSRNVGALLPRKAQFSSLRGRSLISLVTPVYCFLMQFITKTRKNRILLQLSVTQSCGISFTSNFCKYSSCFQNS